MFGIPGTTEFDLRFRLLGIPVRVHPFFWIMALILGSQLRSGTTILIWVGCVFASILVHEFGHALVARRFGAQPDVLLYSFGGLCVYQNSRESSWQRFFVLIMGPGAGFLLLGLTFAVVYFWLGITPLEAWNLNFPPTMSRQAALVLYFLVEINLLWGIFNLMPVMPLDGGQIAMVFFSMHNRREGPRRAYILSIVTGGLLALYMVRVENMMAAIMIGLLAFQSFQMLQAMRHQSRYGGSYEDESDWWKR